MSQIRVIPPNQEPVEQFVSAEFIAKKYKISARYVLLMAAEKRIPSLRIGAHCVRFSEAAVALALEGGGAA